MKEIEIGLRTNPTTGISFFGIDEINQLLSDGVKITKIDPVGAITRQHKDENGNITIAVTGFSIAVKLEGN